MVNETNLRKYYTFDLSLLQLMLFVGAAGLILTWIYEYLK